MMMSWMRRFYKIYPGTRFSQSNQVSPRIRTQRQYLRTDPQVSSSQVHPLRNLNYHSPKLSLHPLSTADSLGKDRQPHRAEALPKVEGIMIIAVDQKNPSGRSAKPASGESMCKLTESSGRRGDGVRAPSPSERSKSISPLPGCCSHGNPSSGSLSP